MEGTGVCSGPGLEGALLACKGEQKCYQNDPLEEMEQVTWVLWAVLQFWLYS